MHRINRSQQKFQRSNKQHELPASKQKQYKRIEYSWTYTCHIIASTVYACQKQNGEEEEGAEYAVKEEKKWHTPQKRAKNYTQIELEKYTKIRGN